MPDNRSSTRREFLRQAAILAAVFPVLAGARRHPAWIAGSLDAMDEAIILKRLGRGMDEDLSRMSVGGLVAEMGKSFLEMPYEANTLEEPGEEHLVVNLRAFDCVTLCETSLALARAIKHHGQTPDAFTAELRTIRYRGGLIRGYGSRLHYFSEWIADNEKKKVLRDVTAELGGRCDRRPLDFMSTHRDSYPRLASEEDYEAVVAMEKRLADVPRYVVPKAGVERIQERIQSGDIIAVTTSIPGLDVSHTGIALREGKTIRLLHAPNVGQKVQISAGQISGYLLAHEKQAGIMVARPLEPV